ncbi:MAG: DUF6077 domain-containing protein [Lachnospiraceae bacterium]|nr:DUF6077 domain-containing protein [Lachnospiraceae bacterium]
MITLVRLLAWILITPWLLGRLVLARSTKRKGNPVWAYLAGLVLELAYFEVVAVFMSLRQCSLTQLLWVWCLPVVLGCVWSLVRCHDFSAELSWFRGLGIRTLLALLPFLLLFSLQAGYVTTHQHIDDDDANYVAVATASVETNSLYKYGPYKGNEYKRPPKRYILAAWPLMLAALSEIAGTHPAMLAHLYFPAILVFWVYLAYSLLGAVFYPGDREKQVLFLTLTAVVLTFSGYSVYSSATFMWIRSWQGKAVLASLGVPLLLSQFYEIYCGREEKSSWLLLFLMNVCCCLFSSMGVMVAGVLCGCCGIVTAWARRSWRALLLTVLCCLPSLVVGMIYLLL